MENIQSKSKVPLRNDEWYKEHEEEIRSFCNYLNIEHKKLYHYILKMLGIKYNLNAANMIYEKELGYPPMYAMDIVSYFPQLWEEADRLLGILLVNIEEIADMENKRGE